MVDDVLGLYVSMDNLVLVHEFQGSANLVYYVLGHVLRNFFFLPEEVVQFPWVAQLQHQVDVVSIGEEEIHFYDVRVVQETLDFNLADHLDH